MLIQHYILTRSPYFAEVCTWLKDRSVTVQIHLNRSRFSLESDSSLYTEFLLRYAGVCPIVDSRYDLATGLSLVDLQIHEAAKRMAEDIDRQVLDTLLNK